MRIRPVLVLAWRMFRDNQESNPSVSGALRGIGPETSAVELSDDNNRSREESHPFVRK